MDKRGLFKKIVSSGILSFYGLTTLLFEGCSQNNINNSEYFDYLNEIKSSNINKQISTKFINFFREFYGNDFTIDFLNDCEFYTSKENSEKIKSRLENYYKNKKLSNKDLENISCYLYYNFEIKDK